MNYPARFSIALAAATAMVTGGIVAAPEALSWLDLAPTLQVSEPAIQIDLARIAPKQAETPTPEQPKRLVDTGAAAEAPVQRTDLISAQASQAQDQSDVTGDPTRAAVDEVDEFEQLGGKPQEPVVAQAESDKTVDASSAPSPPIAATRPAEDANRPDSTLPNAEIEEEVGTIVKPDSSPSEKKRSEARLEAADEAPKASAEPTKPSRPSERFQVAAATTPAQPTQPALSQQAVPVQEIRAERGREGGGAEKSGFTSFEANKHALGEYMLKVRNRVERQWRTALYLRYAGASRTEATVHCIIRPDGTLESVEVSDAGDSLTYAILCRDAVQRAGPFDPFPFDVPEIYRTQNLEITWRFSYL